MTIRYLLLMAACLSCLGCRAANSSSAAHVQSRSGAGDSVVLAYYFHRTQRCASCLLLETTAAREIEEHFAQQLRDGRLLWILVNIEDPANATLRQDLDVRSNGLVLVRMEEGAYRDSRKLDELWQLMARPDDFSTYLVDEINGFQSLASGE